MFKNKKLLPSRPHGYQFENGLQAKNSGEAIVNIIKYLIILISCSFIRKGHRYNIEYNADHDENIKRIGSNNFINL